MRVALAVCAIVLGLGVGVAAAQTIFYPVYPVQVQPVQVVPVQVPDLGGRWVLTATVTNGNFVDQARIGRAPSCSALKAAGP